MNASQASTAEADGLIVVDKPAGMTSHDVVDAVRRRLETPKVGHAGTLDPDATGVLLLGIGKATRLLSYAQELPKRYLAEVAFGIVTSTQDASGDVLSKTPTTITEPQLRTILDDFVGEIEQIPPMVSALKVKGERLYKKARRGEEIERRPRHITIFELPLKGLEGAEPGWPQATIEVVCSSGTYVRTLAHDIGDRLGCGAHLASLRRTELAGFTLSEAVPLAEVSRSHLLPLTEAARFLDVLEVDADAAALVANGRPVPIERPASNAPTPVGLVHRDQLIAVYRTDGDRLVADRVIAR